jgi:hypothetical protein
VAEFPNLLPAENNLSFSLSFLKLSWVKLPKLPSCPSSPWRREKPLYSNSIGFQIAFNLAHSNFSLKKMGTSPPSGTEMELPPSPLPPPLPTYYQPSVYQKGEIRRGREKFLKILLVNPSFLYSRGEGDPNYQ